MTVTLSWPGKTLSAPPTALPLHLIARCDGTVEDPHASNLLVHADNRLALAALLPTLAGQVTLISIDPPFASGQEFHQAGELAFSDVWTGLAGYLQMLHERLPLMRDLLTPAGTIVVHVDPGTSAYVRLLLEEHFGRAGFLNEVIWSYRTGGVPARTGFSRKHDCLLIFSRDPARCTFHAPRQKSYVPTLPEPHTRSGQELGITRDPVCDLCGVGSPGQKYRLAHMRDVWDDIPTLFRNDRERVGYPTQKPLALARRLIQALTGEGDLVADFFVGSGTTLVAAEALGRRWVGCDQSPVAIQVAQQRLLGLTERRAFEIRALSIIDPTS